jgi:anti-sigma B factor antagonist
MSAAAATEQDARIDEAREGFTCVRLLAGPLTAATAPALRAEVRAAIEQGRTALLLDLDAVTGVDAVGVAALLEARRLLEAHAGGTLVLRANPIVCRALKETGALAAFALWTGPGM